MIDEDARLRIREAIAKYLIGEIDNQELEGSLFAGLKVTQDIACRELAAAMLFFSSDFHRHYNVDDWCICGRNLAMIQRWLALLQTAREWPIAQPNSTGQNGFRRLIIFLATLFSASRPAPFFKNEYWPFNCSEDWEYMST